ncbi:hypothetical protein Tneu_1490 [Pyrobaculum neutrophilum V24Sta]|uniref:Uncharacterized protein n=1 Tax=Pyrobaculum neutrophilum (strain DSM 2338 / JCM 9278 / NBRC 100436 / V24Sta) TaxID=444157 RepID=B1Y9I5_PYRNV|nr:hypothetical protein Tneu_1490 [Pyrobaculum neutrophilum V24Sta]
MRIGNHFVEIRNTYPLSMVIPVVLEIGGVKRTYLLTAMMREGHFYADEKTEAVISHPEHGTTRIRFVVPGLYRFGHVPHESSYRLSRCRQADSGAIYNPTDSNGLDKHIGL